MFSLHTHTLLCVRKSKNKDGNYNAFSRFYPFSTLFNPFLSLQHTSLSLSLSFQHTFLSVLTFFCPFSLLFYPFLSHQPTSLSFFIQSAPFFIRFNPSAFLYTFFYPFITHFITFYPLNTLLYPFFLSL